MKYIISLSILFFFAISCSTDDDETMENNMETSFLIKTVKLDGETVESFTYDANDRVSVISKNFGQGAVRAKISYEEDKVVYDYYSIINALEKREFYYNEVNNVVKVEDIEPGTGSVNFSADFILNSNQCNLESFNFYNNAGEVFFEISYLYSDENCSSQATYNEQFTFDTSKIVIVNDAKNNSIKSSISALYKNIRAHNILSSTVYDQNNQIENSRSYTAVFAYNENDYPISETRTLLNGVIQEYTYEYY